jgi:hypothetical protein
MCLVLLTRCVKFPGFAKLLKALIVEELSKISYLKRIIIIIEMVDFVVHIDVGLVYELPSLDHHV